MRVSDRVKMLQNNVAELQKQLANANIRIAELLADNKNKQETLHDVVKILREGITRHGKET